MKILTFGSIPYSRGGKTKHGLSSALFDLHLYLANLSNLSNTEVYLAAIDLREPRKNFEKLKIIGWTKLVILKEVITKPLITIKFILLSILIKNKYDPERLVKILFKFLFYQYAIDKINPEIIQFHGCIDALYAEFIRTNSFKVLRLHGINGNDRSIRNFSKLFELEKRITMKNFFNYVTFISHETQKTWHELYSSFNCKEKVILNGFDPKVFYFQNKKIESNKISLITVATINENKGQKRVIEAIAKSKNKDKLKYIVIGKNFVDVKNKDLFKLIAKYKVDVRILDYLKQEELRNHLSISDFFIMPSCNEGFGMAYIESIACGTPIIIPQHLPLAKEPGILSKNNSIYLNDSSEEAIIELLDRIDEYSFSGRIVADSIKNLTWDNIALQYSYELKNLTNNNG